ncbi:hypothetical protein DYU05_04075 [Mucilaginibacter terrenus]|uniref:XRE family transcriptional regulator n=2 Tax=Mucilaginibacter terrenus TaxID=2482727 RepID=A0A3E2NUU6_9SPHI|nr:hypothetical protein DYU05_04075 [Mucilaginibacter terrenus]
MNSNKKYRINEALDKLPIKKHKQALHILPALLGVSQATLNNYRAMEVGDKQDIPHTAVLKLERFFDLQAGELRNFDVDVVPISKRPDEPDDVAGDFSLSK